MCGIYVMNATVTIILITPSKKAVFVSGVTHTTISDRCAALNGTHKQGGEQTTIGYDGMKRFGPDHDYDYSGGAKGRCGSACSKSKHLSSYPDEMNLGNFIARKEKRAKRTNVMKMG